MIGFGVVGYGMAIFEMSAIPFLIAFVLAPMLERGLRRSLAVSGGDPIIFLQIPIAIIFYILTALAIFSMARGAFKKTKN